MRKGLCLVFALALLAGGGVWFTLSRRDRDKQVLIATAVCPELVFNVDQIHGRSFVIHPELPFVMRIYMIDKGVATLKETIDVDPEAYPDFFITTLKKSSSEARIVCNSLNSSSRFRKNKEQIYKTIDFPLPKQMDGGPGYWHLSSEELRAQDESLIFAFRILEGDEYFEFPHALPGLIRSSKEHPQQSFIAFTCAAK